MHLRRHGAALIAGVLLVTAAGAAAPARAADPAPPRAVGSDDVAGANRAVTQAAATLRTSRAQLGPARKAAAAASAVLQRARTTAATAAAAAAAARAAAARAQEQLLVAQAAQGKAQSDVGALARTVYMQGPYSELQAVLTATDPGDFAERLAAVQSLSRSYSATLRELVAARADVALRVAQASAAAARTSAQQQVAQQAVAGAADASRTAAAATARVRALVADRAHALAVARQQQARVQAQYQRYRAYQRQIAEQTRRAAARAAARAAGGSGSGGAPSAAGSLLWPIPGAGISGGVGWRVHPVYGYRSCHTGVDIRGTTGTPIRAAAAGRVLSVVDGGAYGLHTVISHGVIATMYAHQSRTAVRAGEHVAAGQVIGYVGSSGWVTGPHLHFEVHVNGVPYDPMGWFGGGTRHPVPCYSG